MDTVTTDDVFKGKKYVLVPQWFFEGNHSRNHIATLTAIRYLQTKYKDGSHDDGYIKPEQLSKVLRLNERAIKKTLSELKKQGVLLMRRGMGYSIINKYSGSKHKQLPGRNKKMASSTCDWINASLPYQQNLLNSIIKKRRSYKADVDFEAMEQGLAISSNGKIGIYKLQELYKFFADYDRHIVCEAVSRYLVSEKYGAGVPFLKAIVKNVAAERKEIIDGVEEKSCDVIVSQGYHAEISIPKLSRQLIFLRDIIPTFFLQRHNGRIELLSVEEARIRAGKKGYVSNEFDQAFAAFCDKHGSHEKAMAVIKEQLNDRALG